MNETEAMIQEFKDALHFVSLHSLVGSKFYRLQSKLSSICLCVRVAI